MIRVVVEVREGSARHRLMVQSRSIQGALSIVEEHYLDGSDAQIVFPIEPETFFVRDSNAVAGLIETEAVGDSGAALTQDHTGSHPNGCGSPLTDGAAVSREGSEVPAANGEAFRSIEDTEEVIKDSWSKRSGKRSRINME